MNRKKLLFVLAMLVAAPAATAQTVQEHMRIADSATAALAPQLALQHYENVVARDSSHFEALWKASKTAVDLGEYEKDKKKRDELYRKAELLARKAVALRPGDADAHFHLARALGQAALSVGVRDRVRYAREVRDEAQASLRIDPNHPGALHVLGVWNAEVMRISGLEKTLAKVFLGADFFSEASWQAAASNLEKAAALEPERLAHYLDLARVYNDMDQVEKARTAYQKVIEGEALYYNDSTYQRAAAAELARLGRATAPAS